MPRGKSTSLYISGRSQLGAIFEKLLYTVGLPRILCQIPQAMAKIVQTERNSREAVNARDMLRGARHGPSESLKCWTVLLFIYSFL